VAGSCELRQREILDSLRYCWLPKMA